MTLLVDLDGTILRLRGRAALEVRMLLRGSYRFRRVIPRWRFYRVFWRAVRAMQANASSRTNYEVLVAELARAGRCPAPQIDRLLQEMVSHDLARMGWHFRPVPGARQVLLGLLAEGHRLVLATNPVWPERAVKMRLAWGQLDDIPFSFISHSGVMTRCKPQLAYFQEVLDRLSLRPEECAMVGDNVRKDLPAVDAGIPTFIIGREGTIHDLGNWLRGVS